MITLWIYTDLIPDDEYATISNEIMETVDRVSPLFDIDFEAGERSMSFQFALSMSETVGKVVAALLRNTNVKRVTVTK